MKRILFATAILMMGTTATMAQTTVKGVIADQQQHEGEPFATVRVFKKGDTKTAVDMFLTDADGRFSHVVKSSGQHDIVFSSMGKKALQLSVDLKQGSTLDLDTLYLEDDANALKGIEVVAMKPLVKMEVDKMSYNVADDNDSKSSTVLDMLRKVPMVTVDGQDNITVNGSSSFKVYVDGKPNVMFSSYPSMVFKSMPATAVKSIEVITNPGARYDAEGAGGVLNIVLNKDVAGSTDMNGYNGTVRAQAGNTGWGAGAFLSGQQGRLSYSANVMTNNMKPGTPKVTMEREQAGTTQSTFSRASTRIPFTMGSLSLGYELDSVSTIGLSAMITNMNLKNSGLSITTMKGVTDLEYTTDYVMKNRQTSFSGNLDYQRFFNKERSQWLALTYQLSYSPTKNETTSDFAQVATTSVDLTDRQSENRETTTEHTFQADYTQPIATGQKLSVGAKMMLRQATSEASTLFNDPLMPNGTSRDVAHDYEYKNTIGAAYAEYELKSGNWGAKAGLRYEHTWQDVTYNVGATPKFSTDYGNLVPSANLSYNFAPTVNLGLTYNMRISRPGISYLNPYVDQSDPTALTYGNSDLEVEKSHNTSVVFNAFSQKLMLNLNLHHNFTDNAIEQYSFNDGQKLNTTYGNIVKRHQTGLNGYANWLALKNTRLFINAGIDYTDLRSTTLNTKNNGWTANAMVGLQQTLPLDLKLGVYYFGQSKSYTLQGYTGGMNILVGNLSKTFFNDKLTLAVQGVTGLNKGGCIEIEQYSRGADFTSHSNIRVPIYNVNFTISYAFGNTKRQFQQQRETRVQNDYIEQKSQGEMLQGVGGGMQ